MDLEVKWPPWLTVDKLTIRGPVRSIENLSTIPSGVKALVLVNFSSCHIYGLIEKLGPGISDLHIINDLSRDSGPLNLFRVLAACPNIEQFRIKHLGPFEKKGGYKLTPQHFKNCFL